MKSELAAQCIALRFALIGLAANCYVMDDCPSFERTGLITQMRFFGSMIREHVCELSGNNPLSEISPAVALLAQNTFCALFDSYTELARLGCPLDLALSILVEEFIVERLPIKPITWFSFRATASKRAFEIEAQRSLKFALCFYERRKHGLCELPEIALLDE